MGKSNGNLSEVFWLFIADIMWVIFSSNKLYQLVTSVEPLTREAVFFMIWFSLFAGYWFIHSARDFAKVLILIREHKKGLDDNQNAK